jgi:Dipeptidyl aminopeptidases/acylaminoacyl-peptidases
VLLVHGDADTMVPVSELARASAALKEAGVPVTVELRPGLPHSIDERGSPSAGNSSPAAFAGETAAASRIPAK